MNIEAYIQTPTNVCATLKSRSVYSMTAPMVMEKIGDIFIA